MLANGDPQVIAIPVAIDDTRWLVLRRAPSGAAIADPLEPFTVEQFDGMTEASARFMVIDRGYKPILMSAPDGKIIVVSMKGKRRAVTH